ncbi:hypothetical protein HBI78_242160 [Parastagonospora nodorum]|nr:hypothetical protein HBI78_242160 [Parastagonospora nodorum]
MTNSLRARTLINLSVVLYKQSAARPGLPAKVSNIDLNFVPGVAFIPDVYIANSLRARTLINLSAVLYKQAAARTGLPAEVGNIDLNFVPSVAFIPNVYIADSLRARTLINLSAVLPRARTLINLSAVLYEQADARSGLPAEVSIIDLNFMPGVAFDAIGNVELTGNFLTALLNLRSLASKRPALSGSDLNRRRTDPTIATSLAKRIKTDEDRKKSTHRDNNNVQLVGDNIEELICVSKVKHTYVQAYTVPYPNLKKYLSNSTGNNRNNLNIIVTNPTGREFSRVNMKSLTRLSWTNIRRKQASESPLGSPFLELIRLTPRELGSIYVLRIVSKSDKVPTRELSSHIKTELYPHQKQALYFIWDKEQNYSAEEHDYHKFYRLIITSEDTHCKQTIKKAYIMLPERALLILFIT